MSRYGYQSGYISMVNVVHVLCSISGMDVSYLFILSNSSHSSVKMQRIKIHAGLQTMKYERI